MNWLKVVRPLREGGFVLLITLLVVLLLTVIIFEFDFQSRADLRAAGNFRDDVAAYYVALSGITAGKAILEEDRDNYGTVDSSNEGWNTTIPPYPVGEGAVSGKITDESGKFNLNSLKYSATRQVITAQTTLDFRRNQLRRLFELLVVDPNLVDPIIDWIDPDGNTEPNGAEDETYQALKFPYPTKNAPLDTLEEILYIKGITPEIYQKISSYLTVSTDATGGMINVNTADYLILQSIDPRIDESTAKNLVKGIPYNAGAFCIALGPVICGTNMPHSTLFAIQSNIYSLVATGTVRNTRKTIHAIWNRTQPNTYLYFKVE